MRLVRQYNEIDCGIAVAAMVAGVSWTKASNADDNADANEGLSVNELVALCDKLGSPIRAIRVSKPIALHDAVAPAGTCAILIRRAGTARGHFVAWDGKEILDPEGGRSKPSVYGRRNWLVLRWYVRA